MHEGEEGEVCTEKRNREIGRQGNRDRGRETEIEKKRQRQREREVCLPEEEERKVCAGRQGQPANQPA